MITVHHLDNSRSQRVLWLLEELELPYQIERHKRDPRSLRAPAALRAIHPLGRAPVLTDEGRVLAESGAILEYLVERHGAGRLRPAPGSEEQLRYRYWLHYAEGSLMPLMVFGLVLSQVEKGPLPFLVKPIAKKIVAGIRTAYLGPESALHLEYIEAELGKSRWFAGEELSAADVQMSFPLEAAFSRTDANRSRYPRIASFLERAHARPAFQRARAKVDDFMVASV